MTVKNVREKYSSTEKPASLQQDDLDEYIRYQDEVLEKNAEEMDVAIQELEQKIEMLVSRGEEKTERLYSMEDPKELLDQRLHERLRMIDTNIGERIERLDNQTDEFMSELSERTANWKNRMDDLGSSLVIHASETHEGRWEERTTQKEINRNYIFSYEGTERDDGVIWDEDAIAVDSGIVSVEDKEVPIELPGENDLGTTPRRKGRIPKQKVPQVKISPPKLQPTPTKEQTGRPRKMEAMAARSYPPTVRRPTDSGSSVPPHPVEIPGKDYPCPVCQNKLIFYDKYQRWWCRKCKKWR